MKAVLCAALILFAALAAPIQSAPSKGYAYPTPYSPSLAAQIRFAQVPAGARIRIYNLGGVFIREIRAEANGTAAWDVKDDSGGAVAPGSYFARAEGQSEIIKMMVLP
ncbi:MAG: hypothetical protein HY548_08005 [Elusimicrobia bacterium]|nr:hypothetical protein [Elusimicrobiota bacterium]